MPLEPAVVAPRPGLARPVSVEVLCEAVAAQRSWRGVMRALGFTTSRTGRVLREICDELGIDYGHFHRSTLDGKPVADIIRSSPSWPEALERLGFAPGSGSARAAVRRHCELQDIDVSGLRRTTTPPSDMVAELAPRPEQLRHAGPYLVAAALTMAGVPVSFAPEGVAYDLIGDFVRTGPKRIQVKTVMSGSSYCGISRKEYCATAQAGHRRARYTAEEIDYFACVTFDQSIYLIPIAKVEGRAGISLRRYAAYRLPNPATQAEPR
ncbi:MAG TPA: hypothetical protein VHC43_12685 [Mycobacteriales bacterium]|nr:hypothetical protein [Mycobacteriales bacterium]